MQDRIPSILPHGLTLLQACKALKEKFHAEKHGSFNNSIVTKSIIYHWGNLDCTQKLALGPIESPVQISDPVTNTEMIISKPTSPITSEPTKESTILSVPSSSTSVTERSPNEIRCESLKKEYDVEPGSSWGTLPVNLQRYVSSRCKS